MPEDSAPGVAGSRDVLLLGGGREVLGVVYRVGGVDVNVYERRTESVPSSGPHVPRAQSKRYTFGNLGSKTFQRTGKADPCSQDFYGRKSFSAKWLPRSPRHARENASFCSSGKVFV